MAWGGGRFYLARYLPADMASSAPPVGDVRRGQRACRTSGSASRRRVFVAEPSLIHVAVLPNLVLRPVRARFAHLHSARALC